MDNAVCYWEVTQGGRANKRRRKGSKNKGQLRIDGRRERSHRRFDCGSCIVLKNTNEDLRSADYK